MRKPNTQEALADQNLGTNQERVVTRCEHCSLVQFEHSSALCRRCKEPLGGKKSCKPSHRAKLFALPRVEKGLPLDEVSKFASDSKLPITAIYDIVIAARTLKHRKARAELLSRDESDKLARIARLYEQACKVFADVEKARWWLSEPQKVFGSRSPLQMIGTEVGGRLVEEKLIQIDEGMFA